MRFCFGVLLACMMSVCNVQAAVQANGQGASPALPLVVGRMQAPQIDGRVDEAQWKSAGVVSAFAENATGKSPKAATKAYVGYDDKYLYIGVLCSEPMMSKAVKDKYEGRDRELWQNESLEVFLNPSADRISFFHFITDILGQKFDALGADPGGYNPDWKTAATQGAKGWSVEMAVPFSSINARTPQPGDKWYALIGRERHAENELSASSPTYAAFDAIGRYGTWVFGSLKANMQQQVGQLQQTAKGWPAGMAAESAGWRKNLQAVSTRISSLNELGVRQSYPQLAASIASLQKSAYTLKLKAIRITGGGKSILITKAYPYQSFTDEVNLGTAAGPVDLTLLQDEWVDVAFNIANIGDTPVTMRCTTRHGDQGGDFANLGLEGVETVWQEAVAVAAGDGAKVYDAIVPNPAGAFVIPAGMTTQVWLSVHSPANASGTTEGRIVIQPVDGSNVDIVSLPIKVTTIPQSLTAKQQMECFTWDALLFPIKDNMKLARANYADMKAHGVTMAMISCQRSLPRPKANPDGTITEPMDFTKLDQLLDATHGILDKYYINLDIWEVNYFTRDIFGLEWNTPEYKKAFKIWWTAVENHLKSRGLTTNDFIVCPLDEASDERFVNLGHWVKEVDPSVRTVIDNHGGDILKTTKDPRYSADIWMPHYVQYNDTMYKGNIELMKAAKVPMWVYYYSESSNEKRMDPTSRYMSKFWWAFDNNLTGVGYWAQQLYGDPWYRKPYTQMYDTSLSYPTETGVIPSRRWQAWRQGWQDYNLLALTKAKLQQEGDQASLVELDKKVQETVANGIDPIKTDEVRSWLKSKLTATR